MTKTLLQAPFLRLTACLAAGILAETQWKIGIPVWLPTVLVAVVLLCISTIPRMADNYGARWLFGLAIFALCTAAGGLLAEFFWQRTVWPTDGELTEVRAVIADYPTPKPRTQMILADTDDRRFIVYLPTDSASTALQPGDSICVAARFEQSTWAYHRSHLIAATAFASRWERIECSNRPFSLRFAALKCRRAMLVHLRRMISNDREYAVAAALTTGDRVGIDRDLRQTFSATGSAHVLAISGLHFGILYAMMVAALSFLGNGRRGRIIRQAIILPLLWGFAFIAGLGPSVVRAALMLSLWGIGNALMFKPFSFNTVGVAAFFMLIYNPLNLFDVGFQLSFAAVLSILAVYPSMADLYQSRNPALRYVWELVSVSVAAQIGTAPLCIYYFHQFPLIFLFTNLFAIPLTAVLLGLTPMSLALFCATGEQSAVAEPVNALLGFFISGLEALENVPSQLLLTGQISVADMLCLFAALVFGAAAFVRRRMIYLVLMIIAVAVLIL